MEEGKIRHESVDQQAGDGPHGRHDGTEEEGEGFPFGLQVARGELDAGEDELDAEDEAREVECCGVEVGL